MAIPTYDQFIEPVLRHLAQHPQGAPAREVHEAAAAALGVTEAEKLELLPSGAQPVYKNRVGWAHDRLKRAGLSESPRRGLWKLTGRGVAYTKKHSKKLRPEEVQKIALSDNDVARLRDLDDGSGNPSSDSSTSSEGDFATTSPDDRLEQALAELRDSTARELLESIAQATPRFFERLVLDLLHAMGYGASQADLQHVGRPNDGGIDGIISLDRLGLEKVYVQAKRWQSTNPVGREAIQAFYGALAGQRANKGVFITTSSYTPHAHEFARSVEKIVLIDGARLAVYLMDYGVGVTHRVVKIPKLDSDYFDEE